MTGWRKGGGLGGGVNDLDLAGACPCSRVKETYYKICLIYDEISSWELGQNERTYCDKLHGMTTWGGVWGLLVMG